MLDTSLDGTLWRRPRPIPTEDWRLVMQALLREFVSRGVLLSVGGVRRGSLRLPDGSYFVADSLSLK